MMQTMLKSIAFAFLALAIMTSSTLVAAAPTGGHVNGPPPVGKPATHGDVDRGSSEGKGHNDAPPGRLIGRVVSFSGSTLVVRTPDDTLHTFKVSSAALGKFHPAPGSNIVIVRNGGVLVEKVIPADVTFTGRFKKKTKDQVTFTLPNGETRTISVAPEAAAHMRPGQTLIIVSHDGGVTATTIRPPLK